MCARRKWFLSIDSGRELTRKRSSRREGGSNWRSSSYRPKKIPQAMRNMKNSILIHIKHLDKKWCCYEWRRWWSWKKEYSHETNKISIQLSLHDFILSLHVCINGSILLLWTLWVSSPWCYTTLHWYLSRTKPLCWCYKENFLWLGVYHNK